MKKYSAPAVKILVVNMSESFLAASADFEIGSDDLGIIPIMPGEGNPADAI